MSGEDQLALCLLNTRNPKNWRKFDMAAKKPAPAPAAPPAAPSGGGGKKRLIIMVLLGVVLIGVSVGGTIAALKFLDAKKGGAKGEHAAADSGHAAEEAPKHEIDKNAKPIYVVLKPEITVSFDVNGRQRFLKTEVNFLTRDKTVETALTLHSPVISNAIVMIVSNKTYDILQSTDGRESLRVEALAEVNKIIEKETKIPNGVEQVLFSQYIMQ